MVLAVVGTIIIQLIWCTTKNKTDLETYIDVYLKSLKRDVLQMPLYHKTSCFFTKCELQVK